MKTTPSLKNGQVILALPQQLIFMDILSQINKNQQQINSINSFKKSGNYVETFSLFPNKKKKTPSPVKCWGYFDTGGRGRTGTTLRSLDFESSASANSATPAYHKYYKLFLNSNQANGGANRIWTGDEGFADLCLTTWLWRHINFK